MKKGDAARALRVAAVGLAAAGSGGGLVAGDAWAAEYTVTNCQQHADFGAGLVSNGSIGRWQPTGGAEAAGGVDLNCGPGDPVRQFGIRLRWQTYAGFVFDTSDKPVSITRVQMHYKGYAQAAGSQVFVRVLAARAAAGGYSWSTISDAVATVTALDDVRLNSPAKAVQVESFCSTSASDDCHYSSNSSPILDLYGAAVTLKETTLPEVEAAGGSLLTSGAQRGARSLGYQASDGESGVRSVKAALGGTVVAEADFGSSCLYQDIAACPPAQTGNFEVRTDDVPDGRYDVRLTTTDAAGNSTTRIVASDVLVDNVPDPTPAPPTGVPSVPGAPGGPAAPVTPALPTPGTTNGTNADRGARLVVAFQSGPRTLRVRYGPRVVVSGELRAPSGRPVAGARVEVLGRVKVPGARMTAIGHVTTDAQGGFRYVAPAGPSRTLRFAYRAQLEDTGFASQEDVELEVVAAPSLSVSRSLLRNGQAVRFTGRVPGAPAGSSKVVELQVRKGSGWMTFRSTRLRAGRFAASYRFTRTRGTVRYAFRVRVRAEDGFPFLTGHSPTALVTVRG